MSDRAGYYRDMAEALAQLATTVSDPAMSDQLVETAHSFERLAEQIEIRDRERRSEATSDSEP